MKQKRILVWGLVAVSLALIALGALQLRLDGGRASPVPPGPTPTLEEVRRIAPTDLYAALRGLRRPVVWEIRSAEAFAGGHIPGAQQVLFADLAARAQRLDRGQPIVLVCA